MLADKEFVGSLTKMPCVDWDKEVDKLKIDDTLKEKIKVKLEKYLKLMKK